jgi:hypothetical protein
MTPSGDEKTEADDKNDAGGNQQNIGNYSAGKCVNFNQRLAPSKILHQNELEMRACSVFLNKLSFDSKSTCENHVKLRND